MRFTSTLKSKKKCSIHETICVLALKESTKIAYVSTQIDLGRLPNELPTEDIYVGIDLVNAVGNGRGVFNKRQLFKTKPNHAALVPLSGVLPADTCDTTPPLIANGLKVTFSLF